VPRRDSTAVLERTAKYLAEENSDQLLCEAAVKAVGLLRTGDPDMLQVMELPEPHAGPGEVRIRVRAAAVSPADTLIRAGASPIRPDGVRPVVPGLEVAGTIDEVGAGVVGDLAVGDAVMAMINPTRPAGGGYAQWVVLPEAWVAPAPSDASFAQAATLPMSGLTALRALDMLSLPAGATIAVTGAAGAVGGYAVQLAHHGGLRVLADAAPADAQLIASWGAEVVARGPEVAVRFRERAGDGVDAVIDAAVIGIPLFSSLRAGGTLMRVRGAADETAFDRAAAELDASVRFALVHDYDGRPDKLDTLRRHAEAGVLSMRVNRIFAPEHAADAHRLLEAGGVRGRLVIGF
jgi:NADPH:quinone reductase-like Zn-dependent oxidoreductase